VPRNATRPLVMAISRTCADDVKPCSSAERMPIETNCRRSSLDGNPLAMRFCQQIYNEQMRKVRARRQCERQLSDNSLVIK
jgi:hypothetical protein